MKLLILTIVGIFAFVLSAPVQVYTNECLNASSCHSDASCKNSGCSYTCTCNPGYSGNGSHCTDNNECKITTNPCSSLVNCTNTAGSYQCGSCPNGYSGNGTICNDTNECNGNHNCHENAACNNTIGSYNCTCKPGYAGNGTYCYEVASVILLMTFNSNEYYTKADYYINKMKKEISFNMDWNFSENHIQRELTYIVNVRNSSEDIVNLAISVQYRYATERTKLQFCEEFKRIVIPKLNRVFQKNEFSMLTSDCCFEEYVGADSYKGRYKFKTTLVGDNVTIPCKYNKDKSLHRICLADSQSGVRWNEANMEECSTKHKTTQELINLSKKRFCSTEITINCINVEHGAQSLSNYISSGSSVNTHEDILFASNIISNIVRNVSSEVIVNVTDSILKTVSNLLDVNPRFTATAEAKENSATKLLNELDIIAMMIGHSIGNGSNKVIVKTKNIGMLVSLAPKDGITINSKLLSSGSKPLINEISITYNNDPVRTKDYLGSIFIPKSVFNDSKEVITSFTHLKPTLFINKQQVDSFRTANASNNVQSAILSVVIGNRNISSLSEPIVFTFKKKSPGRGKDLCVFWKFNKGIEKGGEWISSGCQFVNETRDIVTCQCDHLTNFALLFDVYQKGTELLQLTEITWIGCIISIISLVLVILTHLKLRRKLPSKILICICFSLLMLLIIFLCGIERSESILTCQIISGLLHYFLLAKFIWAAMSAINLHRLVIGMARRSPRDESNFFIKVSLFSWSVPAIIVLITGIIEPSNLCSERVCFVHGLSFHCGVVLPVSVTFIISVLVLIMVMLRIRKNTPVEGPSVKKLNHARIALANITLFGLTWLLAIFAVDYGSYIFQVLFCVFASLQGFFIFGFFVIKNEAARGKWVALFMGVKQKTVGSSNQSEMVAKGKYQMRATTSCEDSKTTDKQSSVAVG